MRLRIVNALVYLSAAIVAIASMGSQLRLAFKALTRQFFYAPDLVVPWLWLTFAAGLTIIIADAARRMASARRVGMARYAAILLLAAAVFVARKQILAPQRPTVQDGMAHLVARVEIASEESYDRAKEYTDDISTLTAAWPTDLRDLGFFSRGAVPLRSHLIVTTDASGPTLAPPPGAHPGDVVIGLSRDKQSYWISSFDLSAAGHLSALLDERGRAVVATATKGRMASRLDPLFPEYPHKNETNDLPQP